jgi:YegS/Rv2252/BmrU family lipid kinase
MMAPMADADCWFIIANPVSGGGRVRRYLPRLCAALDRRGLAWRSHVTDRPGDAATQAARAYAGGHRRLLALGGDGTLHELVNGLYGQDRAAPGHCLVAAAALGTGNDWARTLQFPDDPERLAAGMARGRTRRVDLGLAARADGSSAVFHTIAGAGLDAEVIRRTPRRGPRALAYLAGLLRTVARYRAPCFEVALDGARDGGRYWLVLAANGPRCGGGMRLAPAAAPDDGLFDLLTVEPMPLARALARLPKLFDGRLAGDPAFRVRRGKSATIASTPACAVELDGQVCGTTPVTLSLLPAALQALDCRDSAE